jgi:hypothetical protein
MSGVTDSFLPPIGNLSSSKKSNSKAPAGFDSLLNSSVATVKLADDLIAKINSAKNDNYQNFENGNPIFPFSTAFTSTFGSRGPLLSWINTITGTLGLNQQQNAALQDIAVRFKDVTKTTQNVELISAELKKAGIGS